MSRHAKQPRVISRYRPTEPVPMADGLGCPLLVTWKPATPWRWALAFIGLFCVALAVLGVFVPGLPTTVFLIAASALFTKSCPILEDWMFRQRIFQPYLKYVRGNEPMPVRAKVISITIMWVAIATSLWLLYRGDDPVWWLTGLIVAAGVGGTVAIALHRRQQ